jgi:hypothetical protein
MKALGGRVQPGSGCFDGMEDDGRVPFEIRVEHKYTDSGKYRFTLDSWKVLEKRAMRVGEMPVFVIDFVPEKITLAIMAIEDIEELEIGEVDDVSGAMTNGKGIQIMPDWEPKVWALITFVGQEPRERLGMLSFWRLEEALKGRK